MHTHCKLEQLRGLAADAPTDLTNKRWMLPALLCLGSERVINKGNEVVDLHILPIQYPGGGMVPVGLSSHRQTRDRHSGSLHHQLCQKCHPFCQLSADNVSMRSPGGVLRSHCNQSWLSATTTMQHQPNFPLKLCIGFPGSSCVESDASQTRLLLPFPV
jgi:hypothetical protein